MDERNEASLSGQPPSGPIMLLYSASVPAEFLFLETLRELVARGLSLMLFVTQTLGALGAGRVQADERRISSKDVDTAFEERYSEFVSS